MVALLPAVLGDLGSKFEALPSQHYSTAGFMGLHETEAIVLRTYNLTEADKIVVCLTRNSGVIRAVARGARRLKSRFGASLEPFTVIELSYYEKEGKELVGLRDAEIIQSVFSFATSSERIAVLAYLSELIIEFSPPHEPNEKIFRLARAILDAMLASPDSLQPLVRYFEIWMLRLSGLFPELRHCAECEKPMDGRSASYLGADLQIRCSDCGRNVGVNISPAAQTQLRASQRLPPVEFVKNMDQVSARDMEQLRKLTQGMINSALEREPRAQVGF